MNNNKNIKNKKYNYTGNVRCNDIKPLERKFFRYIIRQIDYNSVSTRNNIVQLNNNAGDLIHYFMERYNVSQKQITYYLNKWSFFYGLSSFNELPTPCFRNIDDLIESNNQYSDAIPERVACKYIKARKLYLLHSKLEEESKTKEIVNIPLMYKPGEVNRNGYILSEEAYKSMQKQVQEKDISLTCTVQRDLNDIECMYVNTKDIIGKILSLNDDNTMTVNIKDKDRYNKLINKANLKPGYRLFADMDRSDNGDIITDKNLRLIAYDLCTNLTPEEEEAIK